MHDDFLDEWHRLVGERDLAALERILAEDVSMGAPPYWDQLHGRPIVHHLLGLIIQTIEGFTYYREWHDDSRGRGEIALEFRGRVGDLDLQGIDLITLNERGELQNLDVMIRPMNALSALRDVIAPKMMEFLRESAE
ncbi:MAG: nuclear transport factor 2 family protein [Deltaproteobacteria bacterium]|nr:nuclear transport factor 2 family protein [Deltaproteobacteria bacterium]MBW2415311.1 nuclear transport factor 2 family protein [Deltaproteobacteria bacterium]